MYEEGKTRMQLHVPRYSHCSKLVNRFLRVSQGFLGRREHVTLFRGNKGYFWDKFDGTRDISTIKGNFGKKVWGTMNLLTGNSGEKVEF